MTTCETCHCDINSGTCITGLDENGEIVDYERAVEFVMEQLDFATDAIVEAENYYLAALPVGMALYDSEAIRETDRARINLSLDRFEKEIVSMTLA